jgi:tetrahydromethanopterin S-methyltransferase subunit A
MEKNENLNKIFSELRAGMKLAKCRGCGCMREALENLLVSLPSIKSGESSVLIQEVETWLKKTEPIKYACLGCEHCFPAVAMNIFMSAFPSAGLSSLILCDFEVKEDKWPPVAGEYFAFCKGVTCPVAVSTLASIELAETLANIKPDGLCIVGKTETENIGIEKIIKNTITNPTIRFLIVSGKDPQGHHSGKTLIALSENGVDDNMKVIGSPGKRPILKNVSFSEVETFRKQIQVINMIGCEDTKKIIDKIEELSKEATSTCECEKCSVPMSAVKIPSIPKILASEPKKFKMDKAGYFVIIPLFEKKIIVVEHYSYDDKLLHIIEGKDATSIYSTIIENGWITELSHAAYLGRELAKAELSMEYGFKYIQDKAPGKDENITE